MTQAMKFCSHAGCRNLIPLTERYCSKHKHEESSRVYFHRKHSGGKYEAFYHSTAWKKLSYQYKLANPMCEACLKRGIIRQADIADHVVPIKQDWTKRLDYSNLESLCQYCHNDKTESEQLSKKSN
ncbi:HNH endonuclease signature motif containing protein [Pediococcus damnosus]|uniref:HNH endonuclease signature motif containing protein n=1 Tax=Pediococcus damnosus TaxID=51663 RepID=UPI000A7F8BBD|nr:HNH endonuclease signature motif containing protein [Pediococcus damnosus]